MKRKYNINQIDERMLKYANAYIKQVVNNAQKNYFRNCLKHTRYDISFEEYNDNINYNSDEHYEINVPLRFFDFGTVRIYIESKTLYEELITISFVNQSEKPATDAVISVLSAIYGNRLKQELGLVEK